MTDKYSKELESKNKLIQQVVDKQHLLNNFSKELESQQTNFDKYKLEAELDLQIQRDSI
jgi:hypothetical protein